MKYIFILQSLLLTFSAFCQEETIIKVNELPVSASSAQSNLDITTSFYGNITPKTISTINPNFKGGVTYSNPRTLPLDNTNSFVVYTKGKIDELFTSRNKDLLDSTKVFVKITVDQINSSLLSKNIQKVITDGVISQLKEEEIIGLKNQLQQLAKQIQTLQVEVEELRKRK